MAKKNELGGIFEGLGNLIESLGKLAEKGQELKKSGEFDIDIEGLKGKKGKMMYGFNINTLSKGGTRISSFGNIKKSKEGKTVVEEEREPMVDVFDEEKEIKIIVELPGVDETNISVELKDDILDISAKGGERKYHKEVLLPAKGKNLKSKTYKNGILEITIEK